MCRYSDHRCHCEHGFQYRHIAIGYLLREFAEIYSVWNQWNSTKIAGCRCSEATDNGLAFDAIFRSFIAKALGNPQTEGTLELVLARLVACHLAWPDGRLFRVFEYSPISGRNAPREYKRPRGGGIGATILHSPRCGRVQKRFL